MIEINTNRKEGKIKREIKTKTQAGITLVALVITIIIIIILAVVTINFIFNGGILDRTEQGAEMHNIEATREDLSIVLADAFTEKQINSEYNQDEFLDDFIYERRPEAEVDDEEISLNGFTFELDRSVPKLGEYIGESGNLPARIRKIEVTNQTLSEVSVEVTTARAEGASFRYSYKKQDEESYSEGVEQEGNTYNYTNLESKVIYNLRVELIKDGEVVDTDEINVRLGGLAEGALTFGTVTWQGAGTASTTVTTDTSYQIQYLILPEDTEDIPTTGWQTTSNGGTIANIPNKSNVYARLWDGANASDYATLPVKDEIKPTINSFEATEITSNSIKVQATATDNESGLTSTNTYKFYLNDEETAKGTSTDGTFTYENLSGLTPYKLRVEVYDNAGNKGESTINVTTKEATIEDALDISDNQKIYVKIPNPKDEENPILCYVLYNDETNGLQIISANSVETVTLGSSSFTTSMNSYNSAITTLNEKAEEYNYFGSEYVEARCVGSNPTNPSAQAGYFTKYSYVSSKYQLRDTDTNYETDYNKMTSLGIASSNSTYWLASRNVISGSSVSHFNVRYVDSSGSLFSNGLLCNVYSGGNAGARSLSHGFRPCFTLKSGIKITGGDGKSAATAYTLGV